MSKRTINMCPKLTGPSSMDWKQSDGLTLGQHMVQTRSPTCLFAHLSSLLDSDLTNLTVSASWEPAALPRGGSTFDVAVSDVSSQTMWTREYLKDYCINSRRHSKGEGKSSKKGQSYHDARRRRLTVSGRAPRCDVAGWNNNWTKTDEVLNPTTSRRTR